MFFKCSYKHGLIKDVSRCILVLIISSATHRQIMKHHCASCDRPTRTVKRGPTPSLPAMDASKISGKSTQPYIVYGQAEVRDQVRHNSVDANSKISDFSFSNNNANKNNSTMGPMAPTKKKLLTPVRLENVRGFKEAVRQRKKEEAEMKRQRKAVVEDVARAPNGTSSLRGNSAAATAVTACGGKQLQGAAAASYNKDKNDDVHPVERKQMRENAVDAYYRRLADEGVEDVWKQGRAAGGIRTMTQPGQTIFREKIRAGKRDCCCYSPSRWSGFRCWCFCCDDGPFV